VLIDNVPMRTVTLALLALLAVIQAELWFGKGGVPRAMDLRAQLQAQQKENVEAQARNDQLAAEVRDLQEGLEMVEEKARFELGMFKQDEIFVRLASNHVPQGEAVAPPAARASAPGRVIP
jgi:cell division protein FtsB